MNLETMINQNKTDKEAYAEAKKAERDWVYKTANDMAEKAVSSPDLFKQYLIAQSQFEQYSVNNALLVLAQKPDSKLLKDYNAWKELGVKTQKNTGILIIEPGAEYTKADGSTGISYNPKKVYDVTNTSLRVWQNQLAGLSNDQYLMTLIKSSPVNIKLVEELPENRIALYNYEKHEISVRTSSTEQIFVALSKEIAHATRHQLDSSTNYKSNNFYAYCTSYMMCQRFGFPTNSFNFEKVPELFKGLEAKEIKPNLHPIKELAEICIGRTAMEILKTKERDQKPKGQER